MYISGGWYNDTLQSTGPIKARNFPENEKKNSKIQDRQRRTASKEQEYFDVIFGLLDVIMIFKSHLALSSLDHLLQSCLICRIHRN